MASDQGRGHPPGHRGPGPAALRGGRRSPRDKQSLAASYMRLALNCVKAQLAIALDTPKQLPVQEEAASNFIMTM